jgi:site-specific recombinase XerD
MEATTENIYGIVVHEYGAYVDPAQAAVNNLVPMWLQRFDRDSTRIAYAADIRAFFGTDRVSLELARAVTFVNVNNYLQRMEGEGLTPATMQRRISTLRGFFDWLIALGVQERNPANRHTLRRIRSTSRKDRAIRYLTKEQARALITEAGNNGAASVRDQALISLLIYCALRRSEASSMNVEDIRQIGPYWVMEIARAKGGTDQYVKIPDHLVATIERMKAHYGITSGPLWQSLSNNNQGGRLSGTAIYELVRRTAARIGLEIGAHTLRHTGCTLAIEGGATLQQVQTHARHKNLETTMVYIHQRDKLAASAADMIAL